MKKYKYGEMFKSGFFWCFSELEEQGHIQLENHLPEYCLNELGQLGWKFAYKDGEGENAIFTLIKEIH